MTKKSGAVRKAGGGEPHAFLRNRDLKQTPVRGMRGRSQAEIVQEEAAGTFQDREGLLEGVVIQVHAVQWDVLTQDGPLRCVVKRTLREQTGLPVVGDRVQVEPGMTGMGRIVAIARRRSVVRRADVHLGTSTQLLAANVDQVLLVASIANPGLKPGLLDRQLVAAWKEGLDPVLCLTKIDLEVDLPTLEALVTFEVLEIPILKTSVASGAGLEALRAQLSGKTSVMLGLSGVGKTSLARVLLQDESLAIGSVSETTGKGRHTTSSPRMLRLPGEPPGFLVDMPGQRVFGLGELTAEDLLRGFPELSALPDCLLPNCAHEDEEGCSILAASEQGLISERRLAAYYRIRESLLE